MKKAQLFNATRIGKELSIKATIVNILLTKLDYLTRDEEAKYILTEKGKLHGQYVTTRKGAVRIKWSKEIIPVIAEENINTLNPYKERKAQVKTQHVYILELENDCYYVGCASNLKRRLKEHFNKKTRIKWMLKNPILRVAYTESLHGNQRDAYELEDKLALGLAKTIGVERVRGGKLSGNPDKAPASWLKKINSNVAVSEKIFEPWSNEKLKQFIL